MSGLDMKLLSWQEFISEMERLLRRGQWLLKMFLPYTIVGGTPAKEIRKRFDINTIALLQELQWWDWSIEKISECIPYITGGKIEELMQK